MRKAIIALWAVAGFLVACTPAPEGPAGDPVPQPSPATGTTSSEEPTHAEATVGFERVPLEAAEALPEVLERCTTMGLIAVEGAMGDNIIFSPVSWCGALAMLAGGATHEGLEQIEAAFGADVEESSRAINAITGEFDRYEADPASVSEDDLPREPIVHRGFNAVARDDLMVDPDYLNHLSRWFDVDVERADLTSDDGMEVLSEWIREHTGGRIQETAIEPDPLLVLVLQDALLFAAAWEREFDAARISMAFTNFDGSVVQPLMVQDMGERPYSFVGGWKSAQVPFSSGFTATFILPPVDTDPLTPELRQRILDQMEPTELSLQFPRFALETQVDLLEHLEAWELESLHDPHRLPLEGIQADRGLHLQQAQQQAMIDVSETGTVAVAVTELGVAEESAPIPPETALHLVRPFYMLITHDATGIDLFQVGVRQLESQSGDIP